MKNYLISIIILAAAYLSMPQAAYSQSDSDLVWIKENQKVGNATSMHLSPDGQTFLVSKYFKDVPGSDKIYIYSVETGNLVDSIMHQGNIGGFSPDKRYFYTYLKETYNSVIRKIEAETHQLIKTSIVFDTNWHSGFGVLSDGRIIISVTHGNNLYYILDGNTLDIIDSLPKQPPYNYGALDMCVYTEGNIAAFSQLGEDRTDPDRTRYFSDISLYNIIEKKYIKSLPKSLWPNMYGMIFFPDGSRIAINNNYKLHIVDINTAMILDSFDIATHDILFSSDRIAILFGTKNEGIKVSNINNYQSICNINLPKDIYAAAEILTKDEKFIIAAHPVNGIIMKLKNCYNATNIEEKKKDSDSIIYPNPGTNIFIIKNIEIPDKTIPASISNSIGIIVLKKPISFVNGTGSFSAQGLTPGMYFISLVVPSKIYTYKFEVWR